MSLAPVIAHPRWIARATADAVERHFQLRGYDLAFVPGSRFMHVEPKPAPNAEPRWLWWPKPQR
jgi:hypothetical protein